MKEHFVEGEVELMKDEDRAACDCTSEVLLK
jgi:hypothetical protein